MIVIIFMLVQKLVNNKVNIKTKSVVDYPKMNEYIEYIEEQWRIYNLWFYKGQIIVLKQNFHEIIYNFLSNHPIVYKTYL